MVDASAVYALVPLAVLVAVGLWAVRLASEEPRRPPVPPDGMLP